MKNKNVKILHTADWHIGHVKTPTLYTLNDIKRIIFPQIKNIDLMIIAGDIFDSSISYNQPDSILFIELMINLFDLLNKYNVILRIIRGTYSHDRDQIKNITALYENYNYKFDFKYIEKIEIEHIEKIDTTFLYIPDDLEYSSSKEIVKHIEKQMELQGYDSLDYMVGHGDFIHKYSKHISLPKIVYSIDQFKFIKKLILMGHNHIPSIYNHKVVYCGSINRLRHGEENKKGFSLIDGTKVTFIENKKAIIYKSFIVKEEDDQETLIKKFNDTIEKYFKKGIKGHLRIVDCPAVFRQWIHNFFDKGHKNISVTFKKKKIQTTSNIKSLKATSTNLEIPTENNIHLLVISAIERYSLGECNHKKIKAIVEEL